MNIEWAMQALEQYGLLGIFIVIALEYTCLPMPSEVLLPLAGLVAAASGTPLALAVACSVLAGLLGSTLCYVIAAWGGKPLVEKLVKRFPSAMQAIQKTQSWQSEVGGLSVMIARVIPIFRTWVSFASGFAGQPYRIFVLYSAIGIIIWNTILMGGGYYLFASGIATRVTGYAWAVPIAVLSLVIAVTIMRKTIKKRKKAITTAQHL